MPCCRNPDHVALTTYLLHFQVDHVAISEEDGGLAPEPDPVWSAGEVEIPGPQLGELCQIKSRHHPRQSVHHPRALY
jgi:hypothetical protein